MKIRGTASASSVSGVTHNKHVVPLVDQAARAQAEFTSLTCVTADGDLTSAVDADTHNFPEDAASKSARHDFDATVKIYQWDKVGGPGKGKPAAKTIDGADTVCEIGVVKGGDDQIKVVHFQKK